MATALVTVVTGRVYENYARQLFVSANEFFRPESEIDLITLPGRPGWPAASLYRYHALLEANLQHHYIYLVDADMRFEAPCGPEILAHTTATSHPGYVGLRRSFLPYETRPESTAYIPPGEGWAYYCGGFIGGNRTHFLPLAQRIVDQIDEDDRNGIIAQWHDESHLNRALATTPPAATLSPAYCHPDDDHVYLRHWPEPYPRILVALDKTVQERDSRSAA